MLHHAPAVGIRAPGTKALVAGMHILRGLICNDQFVRLSIGTESESRIEQALDAIRCQIGCNKFDRETYDKALNSLIGQSLVR